MHNHGNVDTSKPSDFKGSLMKALSYNKKYTPFIIISLMLSMISSILTIIGPDKLKEITDIITIGLTTKIDISKVNRIAVILLIIYLLSFIFNYIQGFIIATIANKYSKDLRSNISTKINKLPLSYFDSTTIGDLLSRVTNDVDTLGHNLNQSLITLVSALTLFMGSIIMMFYTNWVLAITAILSSIIGFSLMVIIIKKSQKYFISVQEELGDVNGHIEEVFSGQNIVKVYNAADEMMNKFDTLNEKLFED